MEPLTDQNAEVSPNIEDLYGTIVKATIWFGNPYMVWHDPAVPGGKLGQELVIHADGSCQVKNQVFNDKVRQDIAGQAPEDLQMTADKAADLLDRITTLLNYFGKQLSPAEVAGNPKQLVTLENDQGEQFCFVKFNSTQPFAIGQLSMAIRDALNRADLLVMDGRSREDFIEKLIISFNDSDEDYTEKLTMSREDDTITYQRWAGDGTDISSTYHMPANISAILDNLNIADFTETIPGLPDDVVADDDNRYGHFTCSLVLRNLAPVTFSGDYEKYCLPEPWADLMHMLHQIMDVPAIGVIPSQEFWNRRRRREGDVIYLSVTFTGNNHEYNYLTDDDSIEAGDYVIVPVGDDNDEQIVRVTAKNYYQPDEVPYPLDRVKRIIGPAYDDENDD